MSNPSPNRPRNLFGNTTNPNNDETITPPTTTGVEPSPIAVSHHENVASIPTTEETLISPYRMDDRFECLIDAAFADQSPMVVDTKFRVSAFPMQASPDTNTIRAATQLDNKSSLKREQVRNMLVVQNKRNKVTVRPATSMLLFLRESYIDQYVQEYTNSTKCRGPSINNNSKIAANAWRWEHKFNWGIFKSLQPKLSGGEIAVSVYHNRLLLEDIMLLHKGEKVLLLISSNHELVKKKNGNVGFMRNILEAVEMDGMKPQPFRKLIYFACHLEVSANPTRQNLQDGNFTVEEVKRLCTVTGGGGVNFTMTNNYCHLFKFADIIEQSQTLLFYSSSSIQRMKHLKNGMRKFKDVTRLGGVAARMMDEYLGDRTGFIEVSNHYGLLLKEHDFAAQTKTYKDAPISTKRFTEYLALADKHPAFVEFRTALDDYIRNAIDNLYGKFSEFTTPLISQAAIAGFADKFKTTLPVQYNGILVLLNKHIKRTEHNDATDAERDRFVFYMFCLMMRIRKAQNLTWWAMVNAAATFTDTGKNLAVYFGISTSLKTMSTKLKDLIPYDEILLRTKNTLSEYAIGIAIFDNSQMFTKLKYQRNGKSSSSTIVTSRSFAEPWIPIDVDELIFHTAAINMTYIDQPIPSPPKLPSFETANHLSPSTYMNNSVCNDPVDTTGDRVNNYARIANIASTVSKLRKLIPREGEQFEFMNPEHAKAMDKLELPSLLKDNKYTIIPEMGRSFYTGMGLFQHKTTKLWMGDRPKCSLLVPPISQEDETTNKGAAKVILSLMALFGIMEGQTYEGEHGSVTELELAENFRKRYLIIVGDGLSQMRARTFNELIEDSAFSFGAQHETTAKVAKGMQQIIHVPGDLHGGCFHFLSAIYSLYYAALIQPIQALIGWKRIKGTDVTKCYQQAAGLAMMIAGALEKHLFHHYTSVVSGDLDEVSKMLDIHDPKELAIHMADGYHKWLETTVCRTTDQYLKMTISFVRLMDMYRLFRLSVRAGDAVMIEWLYSKFLPIFLATGKLHYVEIVLGMMEHFYTKLPPHILHLVRLNRTAPLYDGVDQAGNPMAFWAHDAIIELLQKYFHEHNKENTIESWIKNSPHLMFMNKAKRFSQSEYGRETKDGKEDRYINQEDDGGKKRDKNRNKKRTFVPNRDREKKIISEFILLLKLTEDCAGRKYSSKDVWDIVRGDKITTQLIVENETDRINRVEYETMTEEEKMLTAYADKLMDDSNDDTDDIEGAEDTVEFNPSSIIGDGEERGEERGEEEVESERVVVASRKINLTKAKVNMLAFEDIFKVGDEEMKKKNYQVSRLRKQRRKDRKLKIRQSIYEEVANVNDRPPTVEEFIKRALVIRDKL